MKGASKLFDDEIKVTGDLLGPAHRFGHVAVSGMTRYRSGAMDHRWGEDLFVTFFNQGKVVRLDVQPDGSTCNATQHEFVSSSINIRKYPRPLIDSSKTIRTNKN